MNNFTDKETSDLIDVSIGLSRILSKTPLILNKQDFDTFNKTYDIKGNLEKAKKFLYLPKIKDMHGKLEDLYRNFNE